MEVFCFNLWMALNRILGTEEQVLLRRKVFDIVFHSPIRRTMIYSGSRAEGLDMPGSDYDVMIVLNDFPVYTEATQKNHENNIFIVTDNVKPGFVRIRCGEEFTFILGFLDSLVETNDGFFISSVLFRDTIIDSLKHFNPEYVAHGPCVSLVKGSSGTHSVESDSLVALACRTWLAIEWRYRKRNHGWPTQVLIQKIIEEGCIFVPIGNPCSPNTFIEWRISFSLAEKRLVHSFNHTQLLCYGLLKLYLKHVINSNAEVKDLLCSYFLKTSLFYCIEEENISWCKENIFDCFWICFRRLLKWVQQGYCPNYFIKENNMMEGKIYGSSQRILLRYLSQLDAEGHESLRKIPCLSGGVLNNFQRNVDCEINLIEKEFLFDKDIFSHILSETRYERYMKLDTSESTNNINLSILQIVFNNYTIVHIIQRLYKDTLESVPNKRRYKKMKGLKRYIKQNCMNINKCTRKLILATLCYLNGEYKNVVIIVEEVLKTHGSYMTMLGNFETYTEKIGGRGYTLKQKFDLGLFSNTWLCMYEYEFYPQEIKSELFRLADDLLALVPAVPYSNVLLVLSYYHLKQTLNMNFALNELYLAVHGEQYREDNRPLLISLLNKCMEITESHQGNV